MQAQREGRGEYSEPPAPNKRNASRQRRTQGIKKRKKETNVARMRSGWHSPPIKRMRCREGREGGRHRHISKLSIK